MVSAGLYSAGRMSCHFTERRDSRRKFVMVNGTMPRKRVMCQTESLFFAMSSTVGFRL